MTAEIQSIGIHTSSEYGRSLVALKSFKKNEQVLCACNWELILTEYDPEGYLFDSVVQVFPYVFYPRNFDSNRLYTTQHIWYLANHSPQPTTELQLARDNRFNICGFSLIAKKHISVGEHITFKYKELFKGALSDWTNPAKVDISTCASLESIESSRETRRHSSRSHRIYTPTHAYNTRRKIDLENLDESVRG